MATQTTVTELVYKLVADASTLKRDIKTANAEIKQMGVSTLRQYAKTTRAIAHASEDSVNKLTGLHRGATTKIQGMWVAVMAVITATVKKMFSAVVKEASNALEANNKLKAVFSQINDEAVAAAKSMSKYYGVSTVNARSMLADTGNILTNFGIAQDVALRMSVQINQLGVDLASFVNYQGGAAGAANALTKALLGEREAAKALGVAITENDIKNLAQMYNLPVSGLTRQQRALLTLEVMLRQTKNAQGDFARSSKDLENQLRILDGSLGDLKLTLGEGIIPYVIKVVGLTTKTVKGFNEMDETTHVLVVTIPALTLAIKGLTVAWGKLSALFSTASSTALATVAITAVSVAVGALVNHLHEAELSQRDFSSAADGLAKATQNYNAALAKQNALKQANNDLSDYSAKIARRLADDNVRLTKTELELAKAKAMGTYQASSAYMQKNTPTVGLVTGSFDALNNLSALRGMSTVDAMNTQSFQGLKDMMTEYKQLAAEGDEVAQHLYTNIMTTVNAIERGKYSMDEIVDNFRDFLTGDMASVIEEYGAQNTAMQDAVNTLANIYYYDEKAWEDAKETFKETPELISAIEDAMLELKKSLGDDSLSEALNDSLYLTKDWEKELTKLAKKELDAADGALSSAKRYQAALDMRIEAIEQEKHKYLEAIDAREEVLKKQNEADGKTEEDLKKSTEWIGLQKDRANAEKYYANLSAYYVTHYNELKLESYREYNKSLKQLSGDLAETAEEMYQAEVVSIQQKYEDLERQLLSASNVPYDVYGDVFKLFSGQVDSKLSGGDISAWYAELTEDEQKFFDDLLALRKIQNQEMAKLERDHEKEIADIDTEWSQKILSIDTGNAEENLKNKKESIENERALELENAKKTGADKNKINQYYDDLLAEADREEAERVADLESDNRQKLLQSEIEANERLMSLNKKHRDEEILEARKVGMSKEEVAGIRKKYDDEYLAMLEENKDKRIGILEQQRDDEIKEAEKTGEDIEGINTRYDNLIEAEKTEYEEKVDDVAKATTAAEKEVADIELGWAKKRAQLRKLTYKERVDSLEEEKQIEIQKAIEKGASTLEIEAYYAEKKKQLDEAYKKDKKSSYYASMYGTGEGTITGTWIRGGAWEQQKADLEKQRADELANYEEGSAEWVKASERWGKKIGKEFVDNIMDSIKIGFDYIGQLLGGIEGIMDRFAANEQQAAEDRLKQLQEQKDKELKEATDSGRELTREEQDEIQRRQAMYADEIERQEEVVKQQKREAFERQKAFDIAQATISGMKASVDAYSAMAGIPYVGPSLGVAAALAATAFTAAQIAAIAQQPMPSYAVGAYNVPEDQTAKIHKGEAIIPRPFAEELRSGKPFGGSAGNIMVNIYGATNEASVEEDKTEDDQRVLNVYMTNRVRQMVMNGELDAPLQQRYQLARNGRRG